jgi:V/A-type H+/Na+-transporting ATPase subunit D
MAQKIKLTRPELKRQRDSVTRFRRYLPMLKLKQQQLQLAMRVLERRRRDLVKRHAAAQRKFGEYSSVMNDSAGINISQLAECKEIVTATENIAGVNVPVFKEVNFSEAVYSLFATPVWVDDTLKDWREVNRLEAELEVLSQRKAILGKELARTLQRVNLFEKVKIPEALDAIRVIRIHLGDEMTAAVGRAKIAKAKQVEEGSAA